MLPAPCLPFCRSVAGCGVLRQVLLASPALTQFRAAGCSRLMVRRLCKRQPEMACCPPVPHASLHHAACQSTNILLSLLPPTQELRLGTAALSHLDLENCGHLREVQLSEGPSRASLDGGSRAAEPGGERRRKVRGCDAAAVC